MKKSLSMLVFAAIFRYYISILGFSISIIKGSIMWISPRDWMTKVIEASNYQAVVLLTVFNVMAVVCLIFAVYCGGCYVRAKRKV